MTHNCLETNDGNRFYREAGAGEPIILLHCSSGSSGVWAPVMNQLGQDYRVIAPDLLGYGRSSWPRDLPLGQDAELGVVAALLNVVDRPAHLVGHSYGGTVALRAATCFPRQVASLTLIEPVAFHLLRRADEPDGWREIAALAERHVALVGEGRDATAAEAFLTYWMDPAAGQIPDVARDSAVRTAVKVAAEWRLMFAAEDDRDAIAEIDAPTLLICGGRTRTPARRVVEVLRQILPHARHLEIDDAGHMSPLTHPGDIAEAIRRHVVSVTPRRRSIASP